METTPTPQAVWNDCLEDIKKHVTAADFAKWFEPLRPLTIDGNMLTVEVPSAFFVENIENHFINELASALKVAIGDKARLKYSVSTGGVSSLSPHKTPGGEMNGGFVANPPSYDPFKVVAMRGLVVDPQLNSAYTFDTYVVGESNKMAVSVAEQVALAPGKTSFNPLFVYGGPGVGKTHLIQAIGAKAKKDNPDMNVAYLSADRFMRQYMDANAGKNVNGFMHFYQRIELLILDDVQGLAGKVGTCDAFFQIFNHLLQNGRQVVLASDKKPNELTGIEDRLLSRFKSGLIVEVRQPDKSTRLGIVKAKAEADGLDLPEDVAQYVATNVSGNARELQGALVSLLAYSTVTKTELTLDLAQSIVSEHASRPKHETITKETVIDAVCDHFKIDHDSLQKNTKKREIVVARQVSMYLCKKLTKDSLATIGKYLGNRNHSTVVYACRAIEGLIETDAKFAEAVQAIEDAIK